MSGCAQSYERNCKELGITPQNILLTIILGVLFLSLLFAFVVLFISAYESTSDFQSVITSLFVVGSGAVAKAAERVWRGDLADKEKVDETVERVFGNTITLKA